MEEQILLGGNAVCFVLDLHSCRLPAWWPMQGIRALLDAVPSLILACPRGSDP